jgi:tetratricopeptide (TPR) repeat protein
VLVYRDQSVTARQVGRELRTTYVLGGSLRRAGSRLRINAQLVDTRTDYPLWSERYDREMQDVFEVQDEIARKIAEALRITLSPQEQEALASKPTDSLQAYDLYLRGKSYARRLTRQDLEFALQMFESAVTTDPNFALAYAAIAKVCAEYHYNFQRDSSWIGRAMAASQKAVVLQPNLPEVQIANAWVLYAGNQYDEAVQAARQAIERKRDCDGAYYLLARALFAAGRYEEVANLAEEGIEASADDYNVYVPIGNAISALGRTEERRTLMQRFVNTLENHL